jgi:energy-coupling factor transporter ATP-binding protein EcfA2
MEMKKRVPLAERMRPTNFDDFVGQKHIAGKGQLLRRAIEIGELGSVIFYGPPGTGKTTLANIVANVLNGRFEKLNAVASGVAEAKEVIARARQEKEMFGTQTYLLLDECHRWSKAQSDCVLEAIEDGKLSDIDFVEALACTGGCLGGPLTAENNFVARSRLKRMCDNAIVKEDATLDENTNYFCGGYAGGCVRHAVRTSHFRDSRGCWPCAGGCGI